MILVTGGTGLLGSHLLFDLAQKGLVVRAIKRKTSDISMVHKVFSYYSDQADDLFGKIRWVEADLLDFGAMEEALQGITEVYHTGAIVSFYPSDHKTMLKVNIDGTANLIHLALEHQVQKFCYVSSVATLGRAENDGISDEETHWKPSSKNSVYAISKYGAEREVWRGIEEGLKAVIVNPSLILGPGFWNDNSGLFRLVWEGLKYATIGVNGYIDVRDITRSMIGLMEKGIFGERFICSSENLTYMEFFTLVAKYLKKPAPVINVPPAMTAIAWRIEAIRSFLTGSKPEITREMAVTTSQVYQYSHEKIRKALGVEFIPVEVSIREICDFFLKDQRIIGG